MPPEPAPSLKSPRNGPLRAYLSERLVSAVRKTPLELPSIGLERKAYFPLRRRSSDPGVCSRSGWTVSSRDIELVVQFEQRLNSDERFAPSVRFDSKSIASRLFGICVLHLRVGTILPSGPVSAIASFGSSEGHSLFLGPFDRVSLVRKFMDAHPRDHAVRGLRTLFADAVLNDCLLINSPERAFAYPLRVWAGSPTRPGSYSSSFFHIRNTVAAIMRARLSFARVGFVPPSRSRS